MTILCPIDFSVVTEKLVTYAAALAAGMGGELRLLHVLVPGLAAGLQLSDLQRAGELARYRHQAQQAGAHATTAVVEGEAVQAIVAEARRQPADILVIGAHGQTGHSRFLMGSTAEAVVRTAPCATLLVKPGCTSQALRPTG